MVKGKSGSWYLIILSPNNFHITSDRPRQAVLGSAETETENEIGRDLGREPRPRFQIAIYSITQPHQPNSLQPIISNF